MRALIRWSIVAALAVATVAGPVSPGVPARGLAQGSSMVDLRLPDDATLAEDVALVGCVSAPAAQAIRMTVGVGTAVIATLAAVILS